MTVGSQNAVRNFSKFKEVLELPNLVALQTESYRTFLQMDVPEEKRANVGLQAVFNEVFPVSGYDDPSTLEFVSYTVTEPKYSVAECLRRGLTYAGTLKAKLRLVLREKVQGESEPRIKEIRDQEVYLGEIPLITDTGTFIINGAERVIVSQIHRSPGITFEVRIHANGKRLCTGRIMPARGAWIEFEQDVNDLLWVSVDRRRRMPVTTLLRALGYVTPKEILGLYHEFETIDVKTRRQVGRLVGRIPVADIKDPETGEVLWEALEPITEEGAERICGRRVGEVEFLVGDPSEMPLYNTLRSDPARTEQEALLDMYHRLRPGDPPTVENARNLFNRLFFSPRHFDLAEVGRYKLNKKLGLNIPLETTVLTREDFTAAIGYLLKLYAGEGRPDDIDHLGNRRVRSVGELVKNQIRIGLARMERLIRERMSVMNPEEMMPQNLVNPKLIASVIRDFFGRSQLSQFMDQTNPLSELAHKRRLSALGPGGLERTRATYEVRDVHHSHYGRLCPIETPEGPNIGLISNLATYAVINEFGFIVTPYRKVENGRVTDKIEWLTADEEDQYVIAQASAPLDEEGRFVNPVVFVRAADGFVDVPREEVDYMDVSPRQLVSISASLIPFIENDEPTRALMGSNMQRQAVPLLTTEAPLVASGMERVVARDSGACVFCRREGVVQDVSSDLVIVRTRDGELDTYRLRKFQRSNQNTCISQRPVVLPGDKVKPGDLIADGPCISGGELALGKNLLVAFMPWGGYNFQDAILISERVVQEDVLTSIHIEEFSVEARDTKLGREEITRDIPNVGEEALKDLDETGIVRIGAEVRPGDILVGRVTPKSETELSPEEKLLRAIFGEKAADVRDASLTVPPGVEGVVVDVKVFSRREKTMDERDRLFEQREIERSRSLYAEEIGRIRMCWLDAVKGFLVGRTLARELKDPETGESLGKARSEITEEMLLAFSGDYDSIKIKETADAEKVAAISQPYKVAVERVRLQCAEEIERIERGDELPPGVIKAVKVYVAQKRKLQVGDKMAGRHGNKGVVSRILPVEDMPYLPDGTPVDIVLNPLGVPSRMNVGQILETHLGWAAKALGFRAICPVFSGASEEEIRAALAEAGLPETGTTVLYDGLTGEPFDQKVTVGYIYMMKLSHLVDDKVHARSIGPYSLVTQQPLGGKAQDGGQRFGEMEVWALEAYGAAYTLQELLTVKSDDVEGRTRIYESIVKGDNTLQPGTPESFNVLIRELQSLCLDVRTEKTNPDSEDPFDAITIRIASPEVIYSWSHGEVKKPETINYRTFKPEKDGLFCERIFGPTKDWECNCGKYKRIKHKGVICDRCGVEITQSKVRRERMGHITLACPVSHVWFFKVTPSIMGNLLGMGMKALERVLYYENYIVLDPGKTPLKKMQLLTEDEYRRAREEHGDGFVAEMGAGAIKRLLAELDLDKLVEELNAEIQSSESKQKRAKAMKRLRIVEQFRQSGNRPEWMILDVIPVIPPDLRPLVPLDGGRFATSDLNDLYRRVINRNERLKHLLKLSAPDVIIRNEKRMLQEAVDALFDNGRHGRPVLGPGNRPLKSLSDMLRGKTGRFRQNLLGKRVDYSGRSVIVIGPELKLKQCGLPKKMALELFEPFIIRELKNRGFVHTIKSAKRMVERVRPEVWDILEQVTKDHPVLLNRAPTLHRLSIQAFEPVLVEGKAIKIHPLVCPAFNADFDGDQMAVHVPLSTEAQLESRVLMLATNNIFSPANGTAIALPTQDIVLGCYYLTAERAGARGEGMVFSSPSEVVTALQCGAVDLHARVRVRMDGTYVYTTPGRVVFNEHLPPEVGFVNEQMGARKLGALISMAYEKAGHAKTVEMLDHIKDLGFKYSTVGGLSIAICDMVIPPSKGELVERAYKEVEAVEEQYHMGLITDGERYNKVIDIWTRANEELADRLFEILADPKRGVPSPERGCFFNPIYIMADSGSRGSRLQVRQLAGMRGLLAKPSGEIIEHPIISNFREGLSVLEYFISTHGARKGLADTALKTADSGYLTRRLVDVAQDVIVTEEDCGTLSGVTIRGIREGDEAVVPISERIVGRVAAEDVVIPHLNETIVRAGEVITPEIAETVEEAGIEEVKVRSVLTCETRRGVCRKCYGWSMADRDLAPIGLAVGIIAAQSIGEPGTQLTMRTFHVGGTASRIAERSKAEARHDGFVRFHNLRLATNRAGQTVVLNRNGSISLHDEDGRELERHFVLSGAVLHVADGDRVQTGTLLVEWDPYAQSILTEVGGRVKFEDIKEGVTVKIERDQTTGLDNLVVIEHRENLHPRIEVLDQEGNTLSYYPVPAGAHIVVQDGSEVLPGDLLAKTPREIGKTRDITGGLPRVAELFEARRPKDPAIISEIDGRVEFAGSHKGMRKVIIRPEPRRIYSGATGTFRVVGAVDGETTRLVHDPDVDRDVLEVIHKKNAKVEIQVLSDSGEVLWKETCGPRTRIIVPDGEHVEEHQCVAEAHVGRERVYLIPHGKHLNVNRGERVRAGDQLIDGPIDPKDILRVKGLEALQDYLLTEIQEVYRLTGVRINDKHIEVIIRQMLRKVEVEDPGDTTFLVGEQVDRFAFQEENERVVAKGGKPATAHPVLLGITKASLTTESFISAASFQQTTSVLTEAAAAGKHDELKGLKENVIMGHLIPAGTGLARYRNVKVAVAGEAVPAEEGAPQAVEEPSELV